VQNTNEVETIMSKPV